ncbi:MAG: hypothetical protein E7647_00775 [Ruminococcaceae bacterium]|nr:hypothetical protein [Oscillospiraceae bacterium]
MNYIGLWKFHSIGTVDDSDELVYLAAEEYINSPMPYIDEDDPEAVLGELNERKQMAGSFVEICEDGSFYMLMPLPEGVSREEVDEAVKAGEIALRGGMMTQAPVAWEERDGEIFAELGMSDDGFVKISDGEFVSIMTTRYVKVR